MSKEDGVKITCARCGKTVVTKHGDREFLCVSVVRRDGVVSNSYHLAAEGVAKRLAGDAS